MLRKARLIAGIVVLVGSGRPALELGNHTYSHPDFNKVDYIGGWGKSWLQRWAFTEGIDTLGQEPDPPGWVMKLYP